MFHYTDLLRTPTFLNGVVKIVSELLDQFRLT